MSQQNQPQRRVGCDILLFIDQFLECFAILFFVSLFAEFVANDKPFLVVYDGGVYMPVFKAYPETAFGAEERRPFRDFPELFTLPEKLGIVTRAWRRWG